MAKMMPGMQTCKAVGGGSFYVPCRYAVASFESPHWLAGEGRKGGPVSFRGVFSQWLVFERTSGEIRRPNIIIGHAVFVERRKV